MVKAWFTSLWNRLHATTEAKDSILDSLQEIIDHKAPSLIYYFVLYYLFKDLGDELDEERINQIGDRHSEYLGLEEAFQVPARRGFRRHYKLERLGGCIIADSVGLGKTFKALAVIKYYELRNDRVLVLRRRLFAKYKGVMPWQTLL